MKHPLLGLVVLATVLPTVAGATLLGPSPYLCFDAATTTATGNCGTSDSPFKNLAFSYFHLETFADAALNTPGVTETNGAIITSTGFSVNIIDSVDEDDGAIDGNGNIGDSMWNGGAVVYQFDATALGNLPTHVGLVWTDGSGSNTTFSAFDASGALLAEITANLTADGNFAGGTAEDRFFGISGVGPISAISMSNAGAIEVDHLQYGYLPGTPPPPPNGQAPLPATLTLLSLGLLGIAIGRGRRS